MVGLVVTSPGAAGQAGVDPGVGSAYAQGVRVDPRNGRLSFGITYGIALAGHQNLVAVGEARSIDLGVIGVTLAAAGCDGGDPTVPREDQPQPVVVRSTEENSADGRSDTEYGVRKTARADSVPIAEAEAVTGSLGAPGAVEIGSTVSETTSGVVDGVRTARAVTEVSEISIGGDALVLEGLRWEAVWSSAPTEDVSGSFTVEGITVGGQEMKVDDDPTQQLGELNAVLEAVGIRLTPPRVRNESGISFVDPLRISIVPNESRDAVTGGLLGAVQPVRESLAEMLIGADCSNATYITILDIVLGSVTGAGSMNLELGGVTAQSSDLGATSFLGGLPSLGPPPPPATGGSGIPATAPPGPSPVSGVSPPAAGDDVAAPQPPASAPPQPAASFETVAGSRGGPLVLVGLVGLGLLGALAEMDRRKMRKAQRNAPAEAVA